MLAQACNAMVAAYVGRLCSRPHPALKLPYSFMKCVERHFRCESTLCEQNNIESSGYDAMRVSVQGMAVTIATDPHAGIYIAFSGVRAPFGA
jgi:hypothetical protein